MKLSGSKKAGFLSLALLWAIALRAEGHGPASRNDRRVNESAAVARSHKLILACVDESATGACEMLPLEDTLGVYACLRMVGGRSAECEAQLTIFRDIMKPPPSAGMYMYAGYADVAEYSGDSSESSEDNPERSDSESSDSWEEALSSDFDSESSDFVSHKSESRGRAEKQKLNNMEENKVAHVFWPFSVSSDSVSSESSDSESSDSESSYSVAFLKEARVHAAKKKLHNMEEKKSPHVDGPGLRKSHGLRGHNGGTSESSHGVHGMIGGTHRIHRFRDPSDTSFNDRHHGHYGYHGKGDHHRHHGCHVFVYAFIGLCLLLQVALPLVLWRRRRQALARQSGTAGGAASPAEPASSSATTTTRGGEYQPLVNANGTAASDDDDDDIVVTGTPINPPPSAHV